MTAFGALSNDYRPDQPRSSEQTYYFSWRSTWNRFNQSQYCHSQRISCEQYRESMSRDKVRYWRLPKGSALFRPNGSARPRSKNKSCGAESMQLWIDKSEPHTTSSYKKRAIFWEDLELDNVFVSQLASKVMTSYSFFEGNVFVIVYVTERLQMPCRCIFGDGGTFLAGKCRCIRLQALIQ